MTTLERRRSAYSGPTTFDADAGRRAEASRRSLEVRQARAELKRQIAEGELAIHDVMLDGYRMHPNVRGITLLKLIRSAPAFGEVRTSKTLRAARLAPTRTLGSLGRLERLRLATELKAHRPNPARLYGRSDASELARRWHRYDTAARGTVRIPEVTR